MWQDMILNPYIRGYRGYVYHITTWNNIWNQYISKNKAQHNIKSDGEDGVSIYYYSTDGSGDSYLWSKFARNSGVLNYLD